MEAGVEELLRDFFHEARIGTGSTGVDLALERLVNDVRSDSAVCKRDLRRLLERDPTGFLQSACRIIKVSSEKTGVGPLLELLWSSALLVSVLIDPAMLSLAAAIALANRWVALDAMLDIKVLQIGFPMSEDDAFAAVDKARPQRALDLVSALPPNRHVLLSLAKLLRYPDGQVRSKAALLYARASRNPDWVRKMLAEPDSRVRANAVEGLWETRSALSAALFREAALDPDHRVAANALIGLHYCGEAEGMVADLLQNMLRSSNPPARAAAAFAIGHIVADDSTSTLEALLRDLDPGVRGEALRALIRIRRQDRKEAPPQEPATTAVETPAPESVAIPDTLDPAPTN